MTEWSNEGFPQSSSHSPQLVESDCTLSALTQEPQEFNAQARYHELFRAETLGSSPSMQERSAATVPCSLQWYLEIERLRHQRYAPWIPSVLEFDRHAGENVLCWGESLGTDWVQYAKHGSTVTACSPSREHLSLVRSNFELRELAAQFCLVSEDLYPIPPTSIDVVCLSHLPNNRENARQFVTEVHRVLKPGGKVLAIVTSRYDVDFWAKLLIPLNYWWSRWRSSETPSQASRYSRRSLRHLFSEFVEHRTHKRHLRRADVPHLWRVLSRSFLQRIAGRRLIMKAFKPLSTAKSIALAA